MDYNIKTGYPVKEYGQPVKRYCQTLDLKDDAELIARYREAHDRYHSWPEIREGIREVGILEMEIYILGNRLFMIVETPLDFDWQEAMTRLATLPRQDVPRLQTWQHLRPEVAVDGTNVLSILREDLHCYLS